MKRYGNLWDAFISWNNLVLAARKAQRGKRTRPCVQRFNYALEYQLIRLGMELEKGIYRPGGFRSHWITRPKARMISAAPYRDRVVHHALMNVLEPLMERHFHPHSYACRRGKGTHAAANRLQKLMVRYRFALQCDIRKFFPSVDHEVLKKQFRRLIKDKRILWLMDLIVDRSNRQEQRLEWFDGDDLFEPAHRRLGLPIGNLTSQWFANLYLTSLDHHITSHMGIGGYVRYCDDFILLGNDCQRLKAAVNEIKHFLAGLRLKLHMNKTAVVPVKAGLRFVGYRIWPTHRLITKKNIRQFRRRLQWMKEGYANGVLDSEDVKRRLASWVGHARQASSEELIRRLSKEWIFRRGKADRVPCSSRRFLEQ
jgi:retron-type reverse transcriptase